MREQRTTASSGNAPIDHSASVSKRARLTGQKRGENEAEDSTNLQLMATHGGGVVKTVRGEATLDGVDDWNDAIEGF